jgi:hypothetical protein
MADDTPAISYQCKLDVRHEPDVLVVGGGPAGRCVSTGGSMQASIRVMPGCYITGQAAGVAAAMVAQAGTNTRSIETRELQTRLKDMGAYLPNLEES